MKLADFDTIRQFVDTAMQGDPSKTVMSGGGCLCHPALSAVTWCMYCDKVSLLVMLSVSFTAQFFTPAQAMYMACDKVHEAELGLRHYFARLTKA